MKLTVCGVCVCCLVLWKQDEHVVGVGQGKQYTRKKKKGIEIQKEKLFSPGREGDTDSGVIRLCV